MSLDFAWKSNIQGFARVLAFVVRYVFKTKLCTLTAMYVHLT